MPSMDTASLSSAASGSSSITENTRSAPARAENTLETCMEISLIGLENCLEKFRNTVSPPTSKFFTTQRIPPMHAVRE